MIYPEFESAHPDAAVAIAQHLNMQSVVRESKSARPPASIATRPPSLTDDPAAAAAGVEGHATSVGVGDGGQAISGAAAPAAALQTHAVARVSSLIARERKAGGDMHAIDLTNSTDEEDDCVSEPAPAKRRRLLVAGASAAPAQSAATCASMVDLTGDESIAATAAAKIVDDKPPPWLKQSGMRRIVAEFRALSEALDARPGSLGALRRLWLPDDDNVLVWRMECSGFDEDSQGGRDINSDLASLGRQTGGRVRSIVMEATFPLNYPTQPFFLRVATPRMVMYTGHVTAGGSICVEALTNTGTPNSWQRAFTFENIFLMVLHNMIDVEPMVVRTATGPGGRSGPLRVDLRQGVRYCTSEYVCVQARSPLPPT